MSTSARGRKQRVTHSASSANRNSPVAHIRLLLANVGKSPMLHILPLLANVGSAPEAR
jgi:hypothetical protein